MGSPKVCNKCTLQHMLTLSLRKHKDILNSDNVMPDKAHTTTTLCPELWWCEDRYRCKRWLDIRLKPNSTFKRDTDYYY